MPTHRYTLSKPLPRGIPSQEAISHLQNPLNVFALSDIIISHKQLPQPEHPPGSIKAKTASYEITDAVSYLPLGLWNSTVSVTMDFTNLTDGVTIVKHAPLGLTIREWWTVLEPDDSPGEDWERAEKKVQLEAEMEGGRLVVMAFSAFMEGNHGVYLERMVAGMGEE
ncbi:hypothetical protein B0H67DRAFT_323661 [Lasiosphaeris hirsuta]|uniref:DUF7053 domain-containing protein n=1 Tax=Lasiosphaeris hirsuta TaxID=260670 RepID=A0AA40A238_9PEZI|nr:hypothetical protein B0H67DRAFT_323661 [Lasiosphaeris hirsuta]